MQSTWDRSIPCCCKVAAARGKCGLGKVANMDWHEISECAIKYATIRPGSQISKIAIFQRGQTPRPLVLSPWVEPAARAPGALVPPYSGSERPWGACNTAAPLPARGDAPGAQVCVRRARRPLPRRAPLDMARPGYMCCRACTRRVAATAHTDATELWAPGALRLPLSGSTTHAQSQR